MAAGSSTELRLGIYGCITVVNREGAFQRTHDVNCVFQPSHKRVHETTHPFRHVQHSLEVSDSQSTHKSNKKNIENVSIISTICQICFIATLGQAPSLPRETGYKEPWLLLPPMELPCLHHPGLLAWLQPKDSTMPEAFRDAAEICPVGLEMTGMAEI